MKSIILLALILPLHAAPVTLTDLEGRKITATVKGLESSEVLITRDDGKPYRLALAKLDGTSQAIVKAAVANLPADAPRIRLKAAGNAAGKDTQSYWKASWGSYDKDVSRTRILDVTAECYHGSGAAEIVVQWIANKAADPNFEGVLKTERLPIELKSGATTREYFAAVFEQSDANYEALGVRDRDGVKYVGWIVRVVDAKGNVLGMQTSRTTLPARYPLEPVKE